MAGLPELALLLSLLGGGARRANESRATDKDRALAKEERERRRRREDLADQEAMQRYNAPAESAKWFGSQPGAPGYVQRPEASMFPGMPTDITTGGSGRYGPDSPLDTPPVTPAGPAAAPWQTKEEAFRALMGSGLSPDAMDILERQARLGYPSEAEQRQKMLQGREDEEYARGEDTFTTPDGRVVKYRDAARDRQANPLSYREQANEEDIAAYNRRAIAYGKPVITGAVTLDELTRRREALDDEVAMDTQFKNEAALKQGQEFTAKFVAPTPGGDQPIGPMANYQRLTTNAPIPQNPDIPPEISRERFLRESGGLPPIARAEAERGLGGIFETQDKAAAEAAKRDTPIYEYFLGPDGNPYKMQTGTGTVSEANTALRESLKALGLPSTIEGREARTDYTKIRADFTKWQMTTKYDADEKYRRTQEALRQRGLDQDAKEADRRYELAKKQFNQDAYEWATGFGKGKADAAWNRFVDTSVITANKAKNNAGVLKAYSDALITQKDKLLTDWEKGTEVTEGANFLGLGGKKVKYSASGLTEKELTAKLDQIDKALAVVMPAYESLINEALGSTVGKPFAPGKLPPYSPDTGGAMPPLTGTNKDLPEMKAVRQRAYQEAQAEGKKRGFTGQQLQQFINEAMRSQRLL